MTARCWPRAAVLGAGVLLALLPVAATAQDGDSAAPEARLTVGGQMAVEDGDLIGILPLDLSLRTGTRAQTLALTLSAPFRLNDPDEENFFALGDPVARLLYRRGVRNSAIEAELGYRETDLDREILFDDLSNEFLVIDQGRVAQTDARVTYVWGTQAPLGGEAGIGWIKRDYSNTTDPDLVDVETRRADVALYLEPIPLIRARIVAGTTRSEEADGSDFRSDRLGAGAAMQVDKVTNLDVELARVNIRRDENGGEETAEGLSVRVAVARSRPLGDWSLSYASDPGTAGRRDTLMLGRELDLRRFDLSAALGVTRFDGGFDPVYRISLDQEVGRRTSVRASLRQAGVTDSKGDEALNTDIAASVSHQVTELSRIGANVRFRKSDVRSGDRQDAQSVSFGLDYSRTLPNDFSLVAGASVIRSTENGGKRADRDEQRVYLGVNRAFDFLR